MFGPNAHFNTLVTIDHSHRDTKFLNLYDSLERSLTSKFGLEDYDLLFIPGAGTVGIESAFWSSKGNINVIGYDGKFTRRWKEMAESYLTYKTSDYEEIDMYCQLETSVGKVFAKENCYVDAISSFPYYDIPKDTKLFVVSSNKQLGSFVGLAIVGVRKDHWEDLKCSDEMSYLNLSRYRDYAKILQTPSTCPTHIFEHLSERVGSFDIDEHRRLIDYNSSTLIDIFGGSSSPVFVIDKTAIPYSVAKKWDLYGRHDDGDSYYIFTYSCATEEYEKFCEEAKDYSHV